jgi:hypothetical protein
MQKTCKNNLKINDTNSDTHNPVFEAENEYQVAARTQYILQVYRAKNTWKHAEPSRADTTPEKMKATYSTNVRKTTNAIIENQKSHIIHTI